MRTLSPARQEVLRKRVMAAVLREGMTDEAAAALFGVSTKSIGSWRARYETGGEVGLRSGKTGGKPGQAEDIDPIHYEKSYYLEPEKTGARPYGSDAPAASIAGRAPSAGTVGRPAGWRILLNAAEDRARSLTFFRRRFE